jgi:hypothetical protein
LVPKNARSVPQRQRQTHRVWLVSLGARRSTVTITSPTRMFATLADRPIDPPPQLAAHGFAPSDEDYRKALAAFTRDH